MQILSNATLTTVSTLGTFSATNLTLNGGAHIQEGLNATNGVAGVQWDLISVSGAVTLSGLSSNTPLTLDVINRGGLNASTRPPAALGWTFLTAAGGISGYDPDGFAFTTTGLAGWSNGQWSVAQTGNSLQLQYTPLSTVTVLSSPTNGGSVTGGGVYAVGSHAILTATAASNCFFTGWTGGATNNPWTITVPSTNSTYTAYFSKIDSVGDGIPDTWRKQFFGGDGANTNDLSCATADPDGDGLTNQQEFLAGTNPTDSSSGLRLLPASLANPSPDPHVGFVVQWQSVAGKFYTLERATNLVMGFDATIKLHIPATPPVNSETDTNVMGQGSWFYRVRLE